MSPSFLVLSSFIHLARPHYCSVVLSRSFVSRYRACESVLMANLICSSLLHPSYRSAYHGHGGLLRPRCSSAMPNATPASAFILPARKRRERRLSGFLFSLSGSLPRPLHLFLSGSPLLTSLPPPPSLSGILPSFLTSASFSSLSSQDLEDNFDQRTRMRNGSVSVCVNQARFEAFFQQIDTEMG